MDADKMLEQLKAIKSDYEIREDNRTLNYCENRFASPAVKEAIRHYAQLAQLRDPALLKRQTARVLAEMQGALNCAESAKTFKAPEGVNVMWNGSTFITF